MTTLFLTHPACLAHRQSEGHPESPARLEAVINAVKNANLPGLSYKKYSKAEKADLLRVHSAQMVEEVFSLIPEAGFNFIDNDTLVSPQSGEAALYAAGAVLEAIQSVIEGFARNAFCAVRPPGHHAHRNKSGGFCLFNNIAIGARLAIERHGLQRVAIVDFDVHHGDGTQDIFWDDPTVLFISTHQSPLYPFSGSEEETGTCGNIVNIPVKAGTGGAEMREIMLKCVIPRLDDFKPEMIFVSAGYDAHAEDPIGGMRLTEDDYAFMMQALLSAAHRHSAGRLVAVLEGGYNTEALADSVISTLETMIKV